MLFMVPSSLVRNGDGIFSIGNCAFPTEHKYFAMDANYRVR